MGGLTLANKLTISRFFMAFFFMGLLFCKGVGAKSAALGMFLLAAYTDYLDGFMAKKRNEITNFGKLMDPIADKVLTLSAFMAFVEMKLVPAWMVVIIIFRELLITGLRLVALSRGKVIEAAIGGKQKTVSQMVTIFVILVFIVIREAGVGTFRFWNSDFEYWYRQAIFFMMIIAVALTVISGVSFFVRNREFWGNNMHQTEEGDK